MIKIKWYRVILAILAVVLFCAVLGVACSFFACWLFPDDGELAGNTSMMISLAGGMFGGPLVYNSVYFWG